ncbi:hypothetical protein J2T09_002366 [Neorhizobium huautlense]|uniref:Uncharacterized protein n=1 Tax=Neorhizobium huautlense TaxID=67774 RepID=A0ABT9PT33_9HYPH|nr:hypothetical protein [Neorhizobium huautlense]MDP9837614.1 hypothetical protein [Neorhizobium huautlense]
MVMQFFPPPYALGKAPVSVSFVSTAVGAASGGQRTFAAQDIGPASLDRWVVVGVTTESNANISGVSIGGMAAELVVSAGRATGSSPNISSAIYRLKVTSGASADIVVTMSSTASTNVGITVYSVTGGLGLIHQTGGSIGTAAIPLTAPEKSGTIAVAQNNGTAAINWTGATSASFFAVGGDRHSSAFRNDTSAASFSVSNTGGTNMSHSAAVFY